MIGRIYDFQHKQTANASFFFFFSRGRILRPPPLRGRYRLNKTCVDIFRRRLNHYRANIPLYVRLFIINFLRISRDKQSNFRNLELGYFSCRIFIAVATRRGYSCIIYSRFIFSEIYARLVLLDILLFIQFKFSEERFYFEMKDFLLIIIIIMILMICEIFVARSC